MDRREFLKILSATVAGFALFGCRDGLLGDMPVKGARLKLADFENEVKLALSKMKPGMELVRVPMPAALKTPGASQENRFGMAIDLDACDACGKCVLACIHVRRCARDVFPLRGCPLREGLPDGGREPHSRWRLCDDVQALYREPLLRGKLPRACPQVQFR